MGDGLAVAGGDWPQPVDHPQLLQELLALEQGQAEGVALGPPVPVDEGGGLVGRAGQEAEAERAVGHEADAVGRRVGQHGAFHSAVEQVVADLVGGQVAGALAPIIAGEKLDTPLWRILPNSASGPSHSNSSFWP